MRRWYAATLAALLLASGCLPGAWISTPTPSGGRALFRFRLDSLLAAPSLRSAIVGVLVVNAATHDTVYGRNAHTALMPASNMKIVTGAVALTRLGSQYRYRTSFILRGPLRGDTLDGDVFVFGRGDPSVSQRMRGNPLEFLASIADSLRTRGIGRINGRLVHAGDAFPGSIYGSGWEYDDLTEVHGAGVDELLFNEGLAFDSLHAAGGDTLSSPPAIDPAAAYLEALRKALGSRGVQVTGGIARDSAATIVPGETGFDLLSPPLAEILAMMAKPSQNQIAEVVFRTIALEATGFGHPDTAAAIVGAHLRAWGADTLEFQISDGSGLSRHNVLTPATVMRVLLTMRGYPDFTTFVNALPAVGSEGTVRTWLPGTRAAEVVRGKTGTLDMVRAFSGYATSADGIPLVFSLISNHHVTGSGSVTSAIHGMLRALTELPLAR
jgi:D-alanyl-D-alanine carboxypeptidase/D-alanyl-D-alanine-endopeptidase (penicillin-binding protein 4)